MADTNRTQLILAKQPGFGQAPTADATKIRVTGESLRANKGFERSEEIRSDRMVDDTALVSESATGGYGFEFYYGEPTLTVLESAMFNTRSSIAEIINTAADTEIGDVANTTDTVTVSAGGGSFKASHLVRFSGFTNAANNGIFTVGSSTATTVVLAGTPTLTDEAAPPKGAKIKAVGFVGASGDIEADATGLISTTLDFTTLGLQVGQWIKIGGTATGDKFSTAANNTWVRVSGTVTANDIPLDHLPTGWTADNGSGKTIKIWFGDTLKIGTSAQYLRQEKVVLNMDTPQYHRYDDCVVNSLDFTVEAGTRITGSVDFLGSSETVSIATFDGTPNEASTGDIMNGVSNVARIAFDDSEIVSPGFARRLALSLRNNLREQRAIGTLGLIGIGAGDSDVTVNLMAYYEDSTYYSKFDGESTFSLAFVVDKATDSVNQAYVHTMPKLKAESAEATSGARNQDFMIEISARALKDSLTSTSYQIDAFDYFEE